MLTGVQAADKEDEEGKETEQSRRRLQRTDAQGQTGECQDLDAEAHRSAHAHRYQAGRSTLPRGYGPTCPRHDIILYRSEERRGPGTTAYETEDSKICGKDGIAHQKIAPREPYGR